MSAPAGFRIIGIVPTYGPSLAFPVKCRCDVRPDIFAKFDHRQDGREYVGVLWHSYYEDANGYSGDCVFDYWRPQVPERHTRVLRARKASGRFSLKPVPRWKKFLRALYRRIFTSEARHV